MRGGNTQQGWSLRDGVRIKVAAAYYVPNGDDDRPWNNIILHASIKIGGLDIGRFATAESARWWWHLGGEIGC
eukprot:scaffold219203_cov46-Cyclotella_meneghiniana.AAC.3